MTDADRPRLLDWSDRDKHWLRTEAPCRHCHQPTHLRDDDKKPSHKVCAENDTAARDERAARSYNQRF
jgi:hypothetical protein